MLKFPFYVFDELLHLAMHFFQPLPHIENDFDTGKIHAKISGQIQDHFKPCQVFLSI